MYFTWPKIQETGFLDQIVLVSPFELLTSDKLWTPGGGIYGETKIEYLEIFNSGNVIQGEVLHGTIFDK